MTYDKLFPSHFQIILDDGERSDLETLFDLDPYIEPVELVHKAIRAGIRSMNAEVAAKGKDPFKSTRTELNAKKSLANQSGARPVRFEEAAPNRRVDNYIGVPLQERLRRKLEEFLADHEGAMTDEESYALLLDLGLRHADDLSVADVVQNAKQTARRRRMIRRAHSLR